MKKIALAVLLVLAAVVSWHLHRRTRPEPTPPAPPPMGINLGHWLSDEWMFGGDRLDCDRVTPFEALRHRRETANVDSIMARYWDVFITATDFETLATLGFDAVRIPVSAAHLTDRFDQVVARLQWALDQAARHGMKVIVNVQARAGDVIKQPPAGSRRFPAKWSDQDVVETAARWRKLAEAVSPHSALLAYDLSPGPCRDNIDGTAAFLAWKDAIASVDGSHVIYAPWPRSARNLLLDISGGQPGIGFAATIVADPETENDIRRMDEFWSAAGVPGLAAEFSPRGEADQFDVSLRAMFSVLQKSGWPAMWWSYKTLLNIDDETRRNSYLFRGEINAAMPDYARADFSTLEQHADALAQVRFQKNPAFTGLPVREYPAPKSSTSAMSLPGKKSAQRIDRWTLLPSGEVETTMEAAGEQRFVLKTSGRGLDLPTPEFAFLTQPVAGDFEVRVAVEMTETSPSALAGLLLKPARPGRTPYLLVARTSTGNVVVAADHFDEQPKLQRSLCNQPEYRYVKIIRDGDVIKASCSADGITWPVASNHTLSWIDEPLQVGLFAFSGQEYRTAAFEFNDLSLKMMEQ